MKTLCA